jgi:UDP:flavonoid glycosyltransferase YjiC (YdhE family)
MRALVVTWGPGGNLPPMLAAAGVLAGRGHEVTVMASGPTRSATERMGFTTTGFRRSPDPDVDVAFEAQAELVMAAASGMEIALDVRDAIEELRPTLTVNDCMLPAALAASEATGTAVASLVHFLYGPARQKMLDVGGGWTTDLGTLARTRASLGLRRLEDGVAAWEAADLVLVTAPGWLDLEAGAPGHVVHAGPLGVDVRRHRTPRGEEGRPRLLLSFSTTVMAGQAALIERLCVAVAGLGLRPTLTLGPAVEHEAIAVPEEVEVLPVADHDRLMPGCSIVICHGGLGTVLRALAHGIPLLMAPLGRDQDFNARRVEDLGAGIRLPVDAPAEGIRAAVRRLLSEPSFRAAATAAASRIAGDQPDRKAAGVLERAARR